MCSAPGVQGRKRITDGLLRSLLFCPGNNDGRMHKAMAAGADAVILDLEDSVHPDAKDEARALVVQVLAGDRPVPVVVRVNADDTGWHLADLAAILPKRPDAVMLPKCDKPATLRRLSDRLDALEAAFGLPQGSVAILPLITETAAALADVAYGKVTPRLAALCFAAEDLAADLGIDARAGAEMNPLLVHVRHRVAFAAAAAGVRAIDTPFPDPRRPDHLATEAGLAAASGFAGKLCIHPGQIATVHEAFRPDPDRVAWAQATVEALGATSSGVAVVGGRMVDLAHLKLAMRYLGMAEAEAKPE
ncbi:MAG: CoA ester lyase [Opitutaceae bacterium]|nr:CoA ester lyase [Opitutaceae bacterium]